MGIYIKGMELPKSPGKYRIEFDGCGNPYLLSDNDDLGLWHLVSVPPHGRLVDADVLFDRMEFEIKHFVPTDEFSRGVLSGYRSAARASRYASTIIPAEEEE